jgi:hypothetical protein
VEEKNFYLTKLFSEEPLDEEAIYKEYRGYAERLRPYARRLLRAPAAGDRKGPEASSSKGPRGPTWTSTTAPSPT